MLAALKHYPAAVRLLLVTTFTLTVARALTLPYLVVYLADNFQLSVGHIGLLIGGALIVASLLSLYGGHLVDILPNHRLITSSTLLFALAFVTAIASRSAGLFFLCLVLINLTLAVVDIAAKAGFCTLLPVERRAEVFAIKYTLSNVGYALGPLLGVAMLELNDHLPFVASALIGLGMCVAYWRLGDRGLKTSLQAPPSAGFAQVALGLAGDRRLVCFTLGGVLSAVVFGQFTAYLSQYLVVTSNASEAARLVGYLVTTNAVTVIALQYLIGRRISRQRLMPWLLAGMALFIAGLLGFALAGSVLAWCLAMLVFTLGEIIVIPAEYMFIDLIAPEHLRGVYYGAQNLSNLGAALGPVMVGFALGQWWPGAIFYLLVMSVILAAVFYWLGTRRH
ncbi:MFS transporter [Pseudomonas plecoglossicida]|uniref:MFS transporter n=1 Tax=Pseudomonas plecoglossicida TaxID=70775 RepID=A0AAD0QW12_PSEDL|nr:MFS transporter [Pseudomonas plecoglossicida]AXM96033.1 MFS transporter [Pseudomonas plecoglossicida]EPB97701.1 Major facilitator transporter [Pseudomonas plecoglossicida NB2011]QLB56792.1 MFS transporter [Pseudomonas plecoglossicida]